jgi:hypothetical protein
LYLGICEAEIEIVRNRGVSIRIRLPAKHGLNDLVRPMPQIETVRRRLRCLCLTGLQMKRH